ncbi:MAG: tetratricopeptide repeat protein [Desulfobacteraceae bacterium]|nr:tetratricopeptide repeat protein [Desulfobacteraceae bacterium]MCF8093906.1 tetratricopeptide repeat protein [Desulfobacteraceae bacterium]
MREQCREVNRSKTTSSAFLLSRSEPCGPMPEYGPGPDRGAEWTIQTLSGVFAGVIPPGRLFEEISSRLSAEDRFAVMIIRFDDLHLSSGPEAFVLETAGILDAACRERNGFWGVYNHDMLACFLPGTDSTGCVDIAQMVRHKLSEQRNDTVTAGIAEYPMLEYSREEILKNAQKALEHAEFFGPDSRVVCDSVSLNISGDKYYQAGDVDAAVGEFKKALELDAININVLNSLGVCYGVQEDFDLALQCFEGAMELDPGEIMAVYNAGYVHLWKGNYDRALDLFLQAADIDENLFEAAFQAGRICMETGRSEQAKKYLEKAVKLNDSSSAAFRYLGDCYAETDRDGDASTAYKTALKIRPDDAEALSALGLLYEIQGRNADIALMFCRRAVEMSPENGISRHRLGRLYYNRGMNEEALTEFEAARACGHQESGEYVELIQEDKGSRLKLQGTSMD